MKELEDLFLLFNQFLKNILIWNQIKIHDYIHKIIRIFKW